MDRQNKCLKDGHNAPTSIRSNIVPSSILEAIKLGLWDYEPTDDESRDEFAATQALPGTDEKLQVLAERVRLGLPLWHNDDRLCYAKSEE